MTLVRLANVIAQVVFVFFSKRTPTQRFYIGILLRSPTRLRLQDDSAATLHTFRKAFLTQNDGLSQLRFEITNRISSQSPKKAPDFSNAKKIKEDVDQSPGGGAALCGAEKLN